MFVWDTGVDGLGVLNRTTGAAPLVGTTSVSAAGNLLGPVCLAPRLIIAGYHQDGLRRVDLQSWNWRGLDVINAHERNPATSVDGMRAATDAVSCGALDLKRSSAIASTSLTQARRSVRWSNGPTGFSRQC